MVQAKGEEQPVELSADMVVFGTGFKQNLGFLPSELQQKVEHDGLWLHRQVLHPDYPTIAFVNSQTTTFTNITTPALQVRWLATKAWNLDNKLPDGEMSLLEPAARELMREDIAAKQAWKRKNMPNAGGARAYMMQTHQVHYYDELLRDCGMPVRRKTGMLAPLKEIFEPYRPRDYCNVVTGAHKERTFVPGTKQPAFWFELFILVLTILLLVVAVPRCVSWAETGVSVEGAQVNFLSSRGDLMTLFNHTKVLTNRSVVSLW